LGGGRAISTPFAARQSNRGSSPSCATFSGHRLGRSPKARSSRL
jgi:hypothetical protein